MAAAGFFADSGLSKLFRCITLPSRSTSLTRKSVNLRDTSTTPLHRLGENVPLFYDTLDARNIMPYVF